jgi:hypothetical protein
LSSFTTAGLKVPADSKPSPRGAMMGCGLSLFQDPKGGLNEAAARVAAANKAIHPILVKPLNRRPGTLID